MFQVVPEIPQPLFILLNSCFFILFQLYVYFFLLFQIVDLSPGFPPVTVGSLNILFYFTLGSLSYSFILQPSSISSVSILITRTLNSPSDKLAISSSLSSHPTSCHVPCFSQGDCALSGADSQLGGFVYVLGPCGPLQRPMKLGISPTFTTPTEFYKQRFLSA